jgi:acyl carrier protein
VKAKRKWLLNLAQIVLVLLGLAMLLLSFGKIPANLGWQFPWWFSIVFFLAAGVCGFFAIKLNDEAEKQRALTHMACRAALSEDEFSKQFFPSGRAEIAAKLRKILSRHIPIDLSKMQPNDRFVEDLRMDALDSMSTVEYVIEIEKEFEIKIPDSAAEKMLTFQSVVDYVAEAVKTKSA